MRNYYVKFKDGTVFEIHNGLIQYEIEQEVLTPYKQVYELDKPHKLPEKSIVQGGAITYHLTFTDDLRGDLYRRFFEEEFRIGPLQFKLVSANIAGGFINQAVGRIYAH